MARRKKYTNRFNATYKTYRKRYFEKKRYFERMNRKNIRAGIETRYEMREGVMSKSDFYSIYDDYKRELANEGIRNPNVVQYIVSDQAYTRSRKQFRGLMSKRQELAQEIGLDVDRVREIDFRTGNVDIDWDSLRQEYHYLKEELGYTSEEARRQISYYFGSE